MKNTNIKNEQLLEIMQRVSNVTTDYHKGKEDIFVGGLYDVTKVEERVEVWNMATRIDVYVGVNTEIFSSVASVLTSESDILSAQDKVKRSAKKEITVKFYSLKAFELFFSNYYKKVEVKVTEKKATAKQQTKKATATKKNTNKKSKTA